MRASEGAVRLAHTGVNPHTIRGLVAEHGPEGALERLRRRDRIPEAVRVGIGTSAEERIELLESIGVRLVFDEEPGFPTWLSELPDHPPWLFVRGDLAPVPGVAVVGSRRATRYGADLARSIGRRVATAGWPVISGLAAGIDTMGHVGCIQGGGLTTAVLGSGIDVWYPARNRSLGARILESGGGVTSEFPPGTAPEAWRFPARNRIISGLSGAVIVVEAAVRSGALITARTAVDQGRFVMAVPGDLDRETSHGANLLIRDGAHPLTDLDAVIEELEIALGPAPGHTDGWPGAEDPILSILERGSLSLGALVEACGLSIAETSARVSELEIAGLVATGGGLISAV